MVRTILPATSSNLDLALTLDYSEPCAYHARSLEIEIQPCKDYRGSTIWLLHILPNAVSARWASTATVKVRAGCDSKRTNSKMELTSIRADSTPFLNEEASDLSSLRSSLDNDCYQSQGCDIHIYDDIPLDLNTATTGPNRGNVAATWHGGVGNCEGLTRHLKVSRVRTRCQTLSSLSSG